MSRSRRDLFSKKSWSRLISTIESSTLKNNQTTIRYQSFIDCRPNPIWVSTKFQLLLIDFQKEK
jgi:hypothetical protein